MSAARAKGTAWETSIVNYLKQFWPTVERRAGNGRLDRGDITGLPGIVIEAKAARTWRLPEWWRETQAEVTNSNQAAGATMNRLQPGVERPHRGVLWVKRTGKTSAGDGWVIMDGHTFTQLLQDRNQ